MEDYSEGQQPWFASNAMPLPVLPSKPTTYDTYGMPRPAILIGLTLTASPYEPFTFFLQKQPLTLAFGFTIGILCLLIATWRCITPSITIKKGANLLILTS
jgi:hypothetical protein